MGLLLKRKPTVDGAILGDLYVDGVRECFTTGLADVDPPMSCGYVPDSCREHSEVCGDLLSWFSGCDSQANLGDVSSLQFGLVVLFAVERISQAGLNSVSNVLLRCDSFEILDAVVGFDAVPVIDLFCRGQAKKCTSYQAMDELHTCSAVFREMHGWVAAESDITGKALFHDPLCQQAGAAIGVSRLARQRLHSAKRRDLIQALISDRVAPFFHVSILQREFAWN